MSLPKVYGPAKGGSQVRSLFVELVLPAMSVLLKHNEVGSTYVWSSSKSSLEFICARWLDWTVLAMVQDRRSTVFPRKRIAGGIWMPIARTV
ncbi:hypothetical protein GALMADRAFT_453274 [Galerina marginata CBS 339.88]|uniref:Uncharacterized protein n=1 Tax=Galerina marginata (strain CBS 339.88) TaxID=685588 RepID=A0A067T0I4_GALM3|nr:hypothetical protein GALMADRAFT_453274 [Galerina marginata CBS 339.88]